MRIVLGLVLTVAGASVVWACPYSIRDAAFVVRDRQPYRLVTVIDRDDTAQVAWAERFDKAGDTVLRESAVRVEALDPDDPVPPDLAKQAPGAAAWTAPSLQLVTPRGAVHPIEAPEGGWTPEAIRKAAKRLVVSPKREVLKRLLPTRWAVVVYVPGGDAQARKAARAAIDRACKRIVGHPTELGRMVKAAPPVMTLDADAAGEAWLLRALEMDPDDRDKPQAAVVVGRGRRIGGVLTGEAITETALWRIFVLLGRSCACTSDPRWLVGPAVPLVWPSSMQREVAEALGFDPDSPRVAMELSSVWTMSGDDSPLALPAESRGYREMVFGSDMNDTPPEAYIDPDDPVPGEWPEAPPATPDTQPANAPAERPTPAADPPLPPAALRAAIVVLALAAAGLLGWAAALAIRKRRSL